MADLLTGIRAEIDARLHELAPALAEYEQLSTAAEALVEEGAAPRVRNPPNRQAHQSRAPDRDPRARGRPGESARRRLRP